MGKSTQTSASKADALSDCATGARQSGVSSLDARRRQVAQSYIDRLVRTAAETSKERSDFIADMLAMGVPPRAVFQGDRRLELAKRLPTARRIRAVVTISQWMLSQRDRVRSEVVA